MLIVIGRLFYHKFKKKTMKNLSHFVSFWRFFVSTQIRRDSHILKEGYEMVQALKHNQKGPLPSFKPSTSEHSSEFDKLIYNPFPRCQLCEIIAYHLLICEEYFLYCSLCCTLTSSYHKWIVYCWEKPLEGAIVNYKPNPSSSAL